jgi:hypothetical protein
VDPEVDWKPLREALKKDCDLLSAILTQSGHAAVPRGKYSFGGSPLQIA